jgi:micrococcal nuclease
MRFIWAFFFVCMLPILAVAADAAAAKIVSGDEIVLNDGRDVRLEGIKAPASDQAHEKMQALIGEHPVIIENFSLDRYGRTAAQVYAQPDKGDKIWLQGEMLRAGFAFVYPPTGDEARLDEMLKTEDEARQAKRGIWGEKVYADIPAAKAKYHIGHFAFVSGTVLDAKRIKDKVYLHFGNDWREDFTIAIAARDLRNFRKAGIDPLSYQGKTIRVRGWIKRDYGPMVMVMTPLQIEEIYSR